MLRRSRLLFYLVILIPWSICEPVGHSLGEPKAVESCTEEAQQTCGVSDHEALLVRDQTQRRMLRPKIVLFGDSLTQQSFEPGGWGASLTSLYQRKADVVLRGYSGYNTRWAFHTLDQNFPKGSGAPTYQLATLWFGANDAALPDRYNARQHVPIPEYMSNLGEMVKRLESLGAHVIVITPPPVDEQARVKLALESGEPESTAQAERTLAGAKEYAEAAKQVASERKLPVLDLWTKLQELPKWQSLLSDGLHFTPAGNQAVFKLLIEVINSKLPEFREDKLLPDFPPNQDIDSSNHAASFAEHSEKRHGNA